MGKLFELKYDLLLYDVTSTYFEGTPNGRRAIAKAISTGKLRKSG